MNGIDKSFLIFALFLFQGCSSYARITYEFEQSEETTSVFFDSEANDIAKQVSKSLPASISLVQKKQYLDFKDPEALKVYIFSSKERYSKFSGTSPKTRGSATNNEIYISPIIRVRINTLNQILVHELSHVHLRQHIGLWRSWTEVPGWFHEGLAVEVSGGGGAEKISDKKAIIAINSGKHFTPEEKSGLLGHKYAHDYGLKPQMYYRQSNLFVRYLINQNPKTFKNTYLALIKGAKFSDIWISNYGKSIPTLWLEYLSHVQAKTNKTNES